MMEGGNNKEEAGPSRGLNLNEDKRKEELEEGDSEEEEHNQDPAADIITTSYVPGPLLSLKDQIEKDKVLSFS